jgi:hypothetical protein
VLPHPHIGLSTITYLFEGEGLHRDSLGSVQRILPGEVNWMTAARGIVHSERMRPDPSGRLFGLQIWVALPRHLEESEPSFEHDDATAVQVFEDDGVSVRLIAGTSFGLCSDVRVSSPLFYAEARMNEGSVLQLRPEFDESVHPSIRPSVHPGVMTFSSGSALGASRLERRVLDAVSSERTTTFASATPMCSCDTRRVHPSSTGPARVIITCPARSSASSRIDACDMVVRTHEIRVVPRAH